MYQWCARQADRPRKWSQSHVQIDEVPHYHIALEGVSREESSLGPTHLSAVLLPRAEQYHADRQFSIQPNWQTSMHCTLPRVWPKSPATKKSPTPCPRRGQWTRSAEKARFRE